MKKFILIILLSAQFLNANVAPVFQEVHHFFNGDMTNDEDKVNYIINGRNTTFPKKYGLTIAHQNREWDYNWFILSMGAPTKIGAFGIGLSHYSSASIPITAQDNIGPYIDSYGTDTFQSILLSYQPNLDVINSQILLNHKRRALISEYAQATGIDVQLSSDYVLNNSLGFRTRNLLMSDYSWSDNTKEELAKYLGIYINFPIKFMDQNIIKHQLNFFLEYDHCVNYNDYNLITTNISYRFHESISLFAEYRSSELLNTLSLGTFLKISRMLSFGYSNQSENYESYNLYIHAISIGVNF